MLYDWEKFFKISVTCQCGSKNVHVQKHLDYILDGETGSEYLGSTGNVEFFCDDCKMSFPYNAESLEKMIRENNGV